MRKRPSLSVLYRVLMPDGHDVGVEVLVVLGVFVGEHREVVDRRRDRFAGDDVGHLAGDPDAALEGDVEFHRLESRPGGRFDPPGDEIRPIERRVDRQLVPRRAFLGQPDQAGNGPARRSRSRSSRRSTRVEPESAAAVTIAPGIGCVRDGVADEALDRPGRLDGDRAGGAVNRRLNQALDGGSRGSSLDTDPSLA